MFTCAAIVTLARPARAGAELDLGYRAKLDIGFTLHGQGVLSRDVLDQSGDRELAPRLLVRRARIRVDAKVTDHLGARLQTDRGDGDGRLGIDYRLIDAFFVIKAAAPLQLRAGLHLAPSQRQNITASSSLLVFDRPAMAFKSLTWGTRALAQFGNRLIEGTDTYLRPASPVRDTGVTLHGELAFHRSVHGKYWAGVYEGVRAAGGGAFRSTARVQLNFGAPEPGYFLSGTYLGERETVGVGVSYDAQPRVARDVELGRVGYRLLSADVFLERRVAGRPLTLESAVTTLDLGDARALDGDASPSTAPTDARRTEGTGAYVQAAYLIGRLQPWLGWETWRARAPAGSYDTARFGVTHYVAGLNANAKLAYEHTLAGAPIGRTGSRSAGMLAIGLFFTY